jgi:hypothetical protein
MNYGPLSREATAELCARGIGLRRETQVGERPLGIVVDDKPRYLVTPDVEDTRSPCSHLP